MEDRDQYIIRALIGGKDDVTGAVFLPTEVSTGDSIWMTRRDVEKVSAGVDRISEEIRAQLGAESPKLVLQIECCGRGKMMLRDQKKTQILDKLQHKIGSDVPWLGFYSLAEIGPIAGHNCLHNYTSVVVALYGDNAETATLEQQQPIRQPITQAEYNTQPKPAQAEIIELGQANQPLVEEVKRLVATEHDLHEMQDQLDAQYRLYHQLYETGKQFNATFKLANVLQITTHFVLYGLNFERCLILLSAPDKEHYQAKALDGYYDTAEYARVETLTLAADESALAPLWARASQLICVLDNKSDALVALGQKLGMDEYIVIPLEGDAQTPLGLLVTGNTAKMSKFQVRVKPDTEVNVSLANLISQASIAVRNALFYQALETSEKKYRSLFEDSNDAIIIAQADGQLVDLNPAGQLLFGLHADEIESLNAQDLYVNPADRDQFRQAIEQNAAVSDFEVKMQRRDGSQFDALITATLRHAEDSAVAGYQGLIRDITVQKQNERLQAENLRLNTELAVTQRLQRMIRPRPKNCYRLKGWRLLPTWSQRTRWAGIITMCCSTTARSRSASAT